MKMKIVGIQRLDFKMDNGTEFKANKLHCVDLDSKPNGLLGGNVVTTFSIMDDSPLATIPVAVGKEYTVFFDQKGKLAYFVPVETGK